MANIKDKIVAITGASSGIGKATAVLLAEKDTKVELGARRKDNLEKFVNTITSKGGIGVYKVTDVTKLNDVKNLTQHAIEAYGKIDVIINNAGVMPLFSLDQLKVDEWEKMTDVNIKGVFYGIAAALPPMLEQGFGQVINTSSLAGH